MNQPLSAKSTYFGGFCLMGIAVIGAITRIDTVVITDIKIGDIDTEQELIDFHDTLIENKSTLLIIAAMSYFATIFVLIHVFSMKNVYQSLFHDITLVRALTFIYVYSFIIQAVVFCVLLSPSLIIATYYDWDFVDNSSNVIYTGYYIQLFCIHYVLILGDAAYFVGCLTAIIPWIILYVVCFNDNSAPISDEFKEILLPFGCGKNLFCKVLLVLLVVIIVIGAMSSMFSWNDSGIFSLYGVSQMWSPILLVSFFFISIWMIHVARNVDKLQSLRPKYYAAEQTDIEV